MKKEFMIILLLAHAGQFAFSQRENWNETEDERIQRLEWWTDARFGMFIHWGVYALLGKGEWIQTVDQIPVEEYEELYPRFNPKKFDPESWADLAKQAGMKYMIITTKHHDGFCIDRLHRWFAPLVAQDDRKNDQ